MRRLELIHGVAALLLAGSSCTQTVRSVRTVKRADIQATVDRCVKEHGEKACEDLCFKVFERRGLQHCGIDEGKETAEVWHEYESSGDSDDSHEPGCAPGRRPAGLACVAQGRTVAAYFAWAAQIEAASVTAFARVYRELCTLGADAELLARVHRACGDEIAHAIAMTALARRYGVEPTAPAIDDPETTLEQRAIENAIEGCVGEAVAAIHAAFIASYATDAVVRDAFAQIAIEESTHAQLSYDLAAEYAKHLDGGARGRVRAAYAAAIASPVYRGVPAALVALGVSDDGALAATVDHVLAGLAPRFTA